MEASTTRCDAVDCVRREFESKQDDCQAAVLETDSVEHRQAGGHYEHGSCQNGAAGELVSNNDMEVFKESVECQFSSEAAEELSPGVKRTTNEQHECPTDICRPQQGRKRILNRSQEPKQESANRKKRFKGVQQHVCNNELMHPRNKHKKFLDFIQFSEKFPELKSYIYINSFGNAALPFYDPAACRVFSECLMRHFYNLTWWLPSGTNFICPTIPSRVNYIHYVADLLASDYSSAFGADDSTSTQSRPLDKYIVRGQSISGIDIGVGANCIYPLLGTAEYGWRFVGTDVDAVAVSHAKKLVEVNNLQDKIEIRSQLDSSNIFCGAVKPSERFCFTMCNPPFHTSEEFAFRNPARELEASSSEIFTENGELGFISRIVDESCQDRCRALWYTSLVARKNTLGELRRIIRSKIGPNDEKVSDVREFVLYQGKQTRWVIAWSWMEASARSAVLQFMTSGPNTSSTVAAAKVEAKETVS